LTTSDESAGHVLYHPNDLRTRHISYQSFYHGVHLYVAPVLDLDVTELEGCLPGDARRRFTHIWTNETYLGRQGVKVLALLRRPAVFLVDDTRETVPQFWKFLGFTEEGSGATDTRRTNGPRRSSRLKDPTLFVRHG
jgi:hypothetical protein